ncbi:ABC transporter ATP-binding protein [Arabiibacter massiliensis]|uniref:ABC transporter ATP-binding protein n=1 Tax=Arabiibacter massiliensis TaxID=1870985 RepID=UPI0009BB1ADF|nr:ATP-binding cassette domain-containing protein [Arabiibacter massiliensis]
MEKAPLVELRDAVVRRAGRPILSVDSLALAEGERVAVLGPNGSGKSTLVKLITREVLPLHRDEAPVRFRGRARATLSEVKAALGVVSSSMQDQIAVHLPAVDVVAGGLYGLLGLPPRAAGADEARERALRTMSLLGVRDLADRDILTLSTGQARRVLIARALVHDPQTLVFDEPCTGLDPEGQYHVRASMRLLAREGKGIVLVTHYPEDIVPEIDRVVLLKDGAVFADGAKGGLLADETMSALFEVPLRVRRDVSAPPPGGDFDDAHEEEYFSLVSAYELLYTT